MTDETQDLAAQLAEMKERLSQFEEKAKGFDALKAKNEELLSETKAAKQARRDAEDKAKAEAEELARKSGDVAALEKSWQDKLNKEVAAREDQIRERDARLIDLTVNATAQRIAAELAVPGSADVLLPHIKSRLSYADGKLSVLDREGKPSASTVDELATEIASSKAFAPLIVASHATGGGASGGSKSGGAAAKSVSRSAFDSMSETARMAHVKSGGTVND